MGSTASSETCTIDGFSTCRDSHGKLQVFCDKQVLYGQNSYGSADGACKDDFNTALKCSQIKPSMKLTPCASGPDPTPLIKAWTAAEISNARDRLMSEPDVAAAGCAGQIDNCMVPRIKTTYTYDTFIAALNAHDTNLGKMIGECCPSPPGPAPAPPSPPKKNNTWFIVGVCVAVLLLAILIYLITKHGGFH